jgi:transcription elongation factor Elf1
MNHIYKYSLDKSSRKFICPNCNKKTFVKFIDNETNQYLNSIDGRFIEKVNVDILKSLHPIVLQILKIVSQK